MAKTILQIRFYWSGVLNGKIKKKREVKFGDFTIKQLPIPVVEPIVGQNCEVEYLLEYEGKPLTDRNNKRVILESNSILGILSFLTHRQTKLIAWTYPPSPGGGEFNANIEGLYGNIDWNNGIASGFINILKLDEEKRRVILRALVIYAQAINFLPIDYTLGILFLCITVETLASFVYGRKKKPTIRFVDFIINNIPEDYIDELRRKYHFAPTKLAIGENEFRKYLGEIYGEYRSDFVHSGRIVASHEYSLMRQENKLFLQKEYINDSGSKYVKQYVNLPLFEKIVWRTMKNYIKKLLVKNDEGR